MARTDTLGNFLTDVAEAIRTKEGTTEPIAASEFDTRISNLSGGGEPEVEPDYITDGLVAWFDCYDEMTEDGKLMSRVGDDYISVIRAYKRGSLSSSYMVDNPPRHFKGTPLINTMSFAYGTNKDYWQNGYTFEVAGLINNRNNSDGSSGGWLLCSNAQGAWGIGITNEVTNDGGVAVLNGSYPTYFKKYSGYYGKRFGASMFTEEVFTRSSPSGEVKLQMSVDGEPMGTVYETSSTSRNGNSYNKLAIMCYYADSGSGYAINGELYCVRIYNRKLTNEEIAHNHEIDKKRFKLHDYTE